MKVTCSHINNDSLLQFNGIHLSHDKSVRNNHMSESKLETFYFSKIDSLQSQTDDDSTQIDSSIKVPF